MKSRTVLLPAQAQQIKNITNSLNDNTSSLLTAYYAFLRTRPSSEQLEGTCFRFIECALQQISSANFTPSHALLKRLLQCPGVEACKGSKAPFEQKCYLLFVQLEIAFRRALATREKKKWSRLRAIRFSVFTTVCSLLIVESKNRFYQDFLPEWYRKAAIYSIQEKGGGLLRGSEFFRAQLKKFERLLILPSSDEAGLYCYSGDSYYMCNEKLQNLAALVVSENVIADLPMIWTGKECYLPKSLGTGEVRKYINDLTAKNSVPAILDAACIRAADNPHYEVHMRRFSENVRKNNEAMFEVHVSEFEAVNNTTVGKTPDALAETELAVYDKEQNPKVRLFTADKLENLGTDLAEAYRTNDPFEFIRIARAYFTYLRSMQSEQLAMLTLERLELKTSMHCRLMEAADALNQGKHINVHDFGELQPVKKLQEYNEKTQILNRKSYEELEHIKGQRMLKAILEFDSSRIGTCVQSVAVALEIFGRAIGLR